MTEPVEYIRNLDVIRHHCAISTCPWTHDEPATDMGPWLVDRNPETGELDYDTAFTRRRAEREQRVAGILREHHATHPADDWVAEVRALRDTVALYENEIEQDSYGIRPHVYHRNPAEMERLMASIRTQRAAAPIFGNQA